MTDRKVNAGIDAQTGFALQRNLALHLLLDRYDNEFKNRKYFICIEHHDDFVFCFLNENDQLQTVEAYQSKKKSSGIWKLNDELCEVVQGLLDTGKKISDDEMLKSDDYIHQLHFCSNTNID